MKERGAYQGKKYRDSEKRIILQVINLPLNNYLFLEEAGGESEINKVEEWRKQELKEMSTTWE